MANARVFADPVQCPPGGSLGQEVAIRTLLMSDLVGSTLLVERLGDVAAAEVFARVDRITRDLLSHHGGREIDRSDGYLLAFEDPLAAVRCALELQRACADVPTQGGARLRYRCAIHTDELVLRVNPPEHVARGAKPLEIDGLGKHLAARLMTLADGGQTLLSEPTARAVAGVVAPARLVDHGHYQVKGVADPVWVFEVGVPGEAPLTPPTDQPKAWRVVPGERGDWRSLADVPHNLAENADPFVGRWSESRALADRVDTHRLVTVTGLGGVGKTRLVLHYARRYLGSYPGGVWFCDLAAATTGADILGALAGALGVTLDGAQPAAQVAWALASRSRALVILDNFEQVIRYAAEIVGALLAAGGEARFVVTSREPLELRSESVLSLAPLQAPSASDGPAELEVNDAVTLFLSRALDVRGEPLPLHQLADVAAVVRAVDGLPLAIELAAARTRALDPARLALELRERIGLLRTRRVGLPERQLTLTATLDWSWASLSRAERSTLCQLSVFHGGFDLDAVAAVVDDPDPLDTMELLVGKSLVTHRVDRDGGSRYQLYAPVRLYARDRLATDGLVLGAHSGTLADRHARHYGSFGDPNHLDALDLEAGPMLRRSLHANMANLEAALEHVLHTGDAGTAGPLARALLAVLDVQGPTQEAAGWAQRVLALPGIDARDAMQLTLHASRLAWLAGDHDAKDRLVAQGRPVLVTMGSQIPEATRSTGHFPMSIMLRPRLLPLVDFDRNQGGGGVPLAAGVAEVVGREGDLRTLGRVLANLAVLEAQHDRWDDADALYERALQLHERTGDRAMVGFTENNRGVDAILRGRPDDGVACFNRALAAWRAARAARGAAFGTLNLAATAVRTGEPERSLGLHRDAIAGFEGVLEQRMVGVAYVSLAAAHEALGDSTAARASRTRARQTFSRLGARRHLEIVPPDPPEA